MWIFNRGFRFEEDEKTQMAAPKFFSFILTNMEGHRTYISVLLFKENP